MASPLLGSIAQAVASALSGVFLDATLSRSVAAVGGDPADPAPPTTSIFTCKAIEEQYSSYDRANGLVGAKDVRILILAATLAVEPLPLDRIVVRGKTYTIAPGGDAGIASVQSDPAKATWLCRCMT